MGFEEFLLTSLVVSINGYYTASNEKWKDDYD
jgi:hypothetical protein